MNEPNYEKPRRRVLLALDWYSQAIHRGVYQYAQKADWILSSHTARYHEAPPHWHGHGIISMLGENSPFENFVRQKKLPTVNLSWRLPHKDMPMVLHDDLAIGKMGADHFLGRGFKNLAFYQEEPLTVALDRKIGFRDAVNNAGAQFFEINWAHVQQQYPNWGAAERHRWLVEKLKTLPTPLAIMAQNDDRAAELIHACETANISVPEQVAILGCDNEELNCNFTPIPLSSIDSNLEMVGYEGAKLLDMLMKGHKAPTEPILIPPKGLVERKSTESLAVTHSEVASALVFISEHYTEPIGVDDIVASVPMSRRGLYAAFSHHVGRSIADELTMRRLSHAKMMLAETQYKLREISRQSGFHSAARMNSVFHRYLGMSPGEYRKKVTREKVK